MRDPFVLLDRIELAAIILCALLTPILMGAAYEARAVRDSVSASTMGGL